MTAFDVDSLARDLKSMVQDLDELLADTADHTSDTLIDTRKRIETTLHDAKRTLGSLEKNFTSQVKSAARTTDRYVRDNPWRIAGMAIGVGVIVGLLLGRRAP